MNSPQFIELAGDERIEVIRSDAWPEVRKLLKSADVIVIDCGDLLMYRICIHFLLFPWTRKPLVAVDLVLRIPVHWKQRIGARIKCILLLRVAHFIHYFRDISGYTRRFGISAARSSYVPFKVNIQDIRLSPAEIGEDYIFTMGRSLRDYDSFIRAVTDQALLVPPHDVAALKDAIRRAWEDDSLRKWTAELGRNYAHSLGGEEEFLQRIFRHTLGLSL